MVEVDGADQSGAAAGAAPPNGRHVFAPSRRPLPAAERAEGAWIFDTEGRRYLDAAGGAIVVGVGHGARDVVEAIAAQERRVAYVHRTAFSTHAVDAFADELAPLLPIDEPRIYPVSGGSEAVETALKMARAYHVARGEPSRVRVVSRRDSYHGSTVGALDASGREPLRRHYEPWLGRSVHVSPAYEYRCASSTHPTDCGRLLADELEETILREGAETIACFIAEPISGASLGAAVPTDDYWPAIAEVCRRHGVLLIADEVMTGFGRTGAWFGVDHWGVRPDILTAGKGVTSGYWPFGLAVASGAVYETIMSAGGFVHGFTFSHSAPGSAAARAVLRRLQEDGLVEASREKGDRLLGLLAAAIGDHPLVGDIRGRGLMVGVELVLDREARTPFPRTESIAERVVASALDEGLVLYSSTGCVDGTNGDLVMFGPPFVISDDELELAADATRRALDRVAAGVVG
jgi:adenosylmethionine-8-amino-7-oxononanoate aminotransferase